MNIFVFLAAIVALVTLIGHFTFGYSSYVKPMLAAQFDPIAKRVMLCVFHYISLFLILSVLSLSVIGLGFWEENGASSVVIFIALNFLGFAIWQLVLAFTIPLRNAPFKLFQWIFFLLVALFAGLSLY